MKAIFSLLLVFYWLAGISQPSGPIIIQRPNCKNFEVKITKNPRPGQCDRCCYNITIVNRYAGIPAFGPKSFRITVNQATIVSESGTPAGWSKTHYSTPPNINTIVWNKTSGPIPTGQINLSNICFDNILADPFFIKYEWLDTHGIVMCRDSVKVTCRTERPNCGKFAIALYNGVSPTQFSKVKITPLPGSRIVNAMVGDPDEDGDAEWHQSVGPGYSFVEWSCVSSAIPFNISSYMDEEMYIWMDPTIIANQTVRIDWYNSSNTVVASQSIFLPCLGDPAIVYTDQYDWEANTTILSGASLNVFAGAAPEDCALDIAERTNDCGNNIIYSVTCVGNKPTLTFSCGPLVSGESGMNWNLEDPFGAVTVPSNNLQFTQSGNYTLMLTINHSPVFDYTDPQNPVDITPADCDYEETFYVSIPVPIISDPVITPVQQNPAGCNFLVALNAYQSGSVTGSSTYSWVITGPNNFTHAFTGQSISYVFIDQGNYTATLTITDQYGCTHSVSKPFTLSYACTPKFTWGTYEWCKDGNDPIPKTIVIDFTNTSQGGKCPISYKWDFGDPGSGTLNTSTSTNGQHTYNNVPGSGRSFTVKLTMTDANNCSVVYSQTIQLAPYHVDFTILPCPDGKVFFSTTNDNPLWTFAGSNNPLTWISQYVFGLFGWYNNSDPVVEYETGNYTAILKATSNTTHAWCIVKKQFHVEKICCQWRVKGQYKTTNTIGGKTYRMWVMWKWKVKRHHPINAVHTKIKVSNRVAKKISKRHDWFRRILADKVYAGIEGTYYVKGTSGLCECIDPRQQQDARRTWSLRGKSVYRPGVSEVRNIRFQSMKAKFGVIINGVPWDDSTYFDPCH